MPTATGVSLRHFLGWLVSVFRSREDLVLENLALHRQLLALHAQQPRRRFTALHKLFWVALRTFWSGWTKPLILVTPRTVVNWRRAGFRLYWTFGVLYCFFVIGHDRRKILHLNVTRNPSALWVVQQLREAMGLPTAAQILAIRPRRKVWSRGGFGCEGHGKRANSHGLSQSVAERCCGALGGKLPTRLAGPRDHLE